MSGRAWSQMCRAMLAVVGVAAPGRGLVARATGGTRLPGAGNLGRRRPAGPQTQPLARPGKGGPEVPIGTREGDQVDEVTVRVDIGIVAPSAAARPGQADGQRLPGLAVDRAGAVPVAAALAAGQQFGDERLGPVGEEPRHVDIVEPFSPPHRDGATVSSSSSSSASGGSPITPPLMKLRALVCRVLRNDASARRRREKPLSLSVAP